VGLRFALQVNAIIELPSVFCAVIAFGGLAELSAKNAFIRLDIEILTNENFV